jgi:hypothetical protein
VGDVPVQPEEEPEVSEYREKLVALRNRLDDGVRTTVAGSTVEPVRRPVLMTLIGVALVLNIPVLGIVALLAIVYTDRVV